MKQAEVKIGMEARVKIGGRLAPVIVTDKRHQRRSNETWMVVFECRTLDTGRAIVATAARLRPVPGTPEAAAEQARKRAAEARRIAKTPAGTYTSKPAPAAPVLVPPAPVPGMVRRVDPSRLVEPLIGHNREAVERIVAGVHVAMSWSAACRAVFRVINKNGDLHTFPKALRRGAWLKVAEEHAANRRLYLETMGHAPTPSVEMIEDAMAGDVHARAAVLA